MKHMLKQPKTSTFLWSGFIPRTSCNRARLKYENSLNLSGPKQGSGFPACGIARGLRSLAQASSSPKSSEAPGPSIPPRANPEEILNDIAEGRFGPYPPAEALQAVAALPLPALSAAARAVRDRRVSSPGVITFSPKVFIPLTRLCRDNCGYCTFAIAPLPGSRAYMTLDEVLEVARQGKEQGCTEALFTLGDKPELRYPEARAELQSMGLASTAEYVRVAAEHVLRETGLLPHVNAGVLTEEELRSLRTVSVSQGLMMESTSEELLLPGAAHADSPDKDPKARLECLEAAGRAGIPFTSGVLIGIGETRPDRISTLLAIRSVHESHGHIQEIIVQNFRAKKGTRMAASPEPPLAELVWTAAMARLAFGPDMGIQAPPNLTPSEDDAAPSSPSAPPAASWRALLDAGISDWGGVSPVTRDWVNPERPWPHLEPLARATAEAGFLLAPRLPIYPAYALENGGRWMDEAGGLRSPAGATRILMDGQGLLRGHAWVAGAAESGAVEGEPRGDPGAASVSGRGGEGQERGAGVRYGPSAKVGKALWRVGVSREGVMEGCPEPSRPSTRVLKTLDSLRAAAAASTPADVSLEDLALLFEARGPDYRAVVEAADELRREQCGDEVTYVVNRNINYTNVCTYRCQFCAFSKGKAAESLRGPAYLVALEEIERRTREAWGRGATEVCMQGGIHPDFDGRTYLRILEAAKRGAPDIHVHAFSPLEVFQGAATLGLPLTDYLRDLKAAGLGSLPGTAAEVLDDGVRSVLCPDKLSAPQWIEVVRAAHSVGLRTTSTIMFGHCDDYRSWARHLMALRDLQVETGGLSEFVPLPLVHMEAPLYLKGKSRRGPTLREAVLMHAVGRLVLGQHVKNIQASWVKMGPKYAGGLLSAGCNDMGGVLMNESITRAAGAEHGQELGPRELDSLIRAAGRTPVQRTTLYGMPSQAQVDTSYACGELQPLAFAAPFGGAAAGMRL